MTQAEFEAGIKHFMDQLVMEVRSGLHDGEEISVEILVTLMREALTDGTIPADKLVDAALTLAAASIIELAKKPPF